MLPVIGGKKMNNIDNNDILYSRVFLILIVTENINIAGQSDLLWLIHFTIQHVYKAHYGVFFDKIYTYSN